METNKCVIPGCTEHATASTRYCRQHYLERKREAFNRRYNSGNYLRTRYTCTCIWCGKVFDGYRKDSLWCSDTCKAETCKATKSVSNYKLSTSRGKEAFLHKQIAIKAIGEGALEGKSLHHKDFNPSNNALNNLLVLDRNTHSALHSYIRIEAAKRTDPKDSNRLQHIYDIIPQLTTEFLEHSGVTVKSVQDIVDEAR